MTDLELLDALDAGEAYDWEFKSARGGLPGSAWETYSAMANTDGGVLVLGVEEAEHRFRVSGIADLPRMKKSFWDTVNNPSKVNINLLREDDVRAVETGGSTVLVVRVPRADRRQRPVYVGLNPLTGTYRRNYEGDYHCTPDEVGRMLADRSEEPADSRILEHFGMDDLDPTSLREYRNRFASRDPSHPWLQLNDRALLEKLGGWRRERSSGREWLTLAGLLMFGKDEAIRDPSAVPQFHIDYREHLSEDPAVRWTDRLTVDGKWVANLLQFYQRVVNRLTADVKVPFQLAADLQRIDDTPVHQALREALVNALIHTDYREVGGIVVQKYRDRFVLSNPGTMLVSLEQLRHGAVTECRNKALQTMFQLIGFGEKAGSGFDKIRRGWASQHWQAPAIEETTGPNRVWLTLSMVSLLPEEALAALREQFGEDFHQLPPVQVQILVVAYTEGRVSNLRMQLACDEHSADLTKMFQGLVARGFLKRHGQKKGTYYQLPASSGHNDGSSGHNDGSSGHNDGSSGHNDGSSAVEEVGEALLARTSPEEAELLRIAQAAREKKRLRPEQMRQILCELCNGRYLTASQLAELVKRDATKLQKRFLASMVADGTLALQFPEDPTHPRQAYTRPGRKTEA